MSGARHSVFDEIKAISLRTQLHVLQQWNARTTRRFGIITRLYGRKGTHRIRLYRSGAARDKPQ